MGQIAWWRRLWVGDLHTCVAFTIDGTRIRLCSGVLERITAREALSHRWFVDVVWISQPLVEFSEPCSIK